jgi:nickel transport protein
MRLPLFALLTACAIAPAAAHDLWLEKEGKRWTLYQGHRPGGHAGAEMLAYGGSFVTDARCYDARGGQRPLAVLGDSPWSASGDCAALQVEVSSGYWSKTPWETKNVPKPQAPGALKSWLSRDALKHIERWSPLFAQPFSIGLDLAPTTDPFALKPGDKLVVRVTREGQPLAGVSVAYDGDPRGETDPDGRVAIRLRHPGVQLISASVELLLKDGKADVEILAATLQFELRP